jgi:hypothetical protein
VVEQTTICPYCWRRNNLSSGLDPMAGPRPGDVTVCWSCRRVAVMDESGKLRVPTLAEQAAINVDDRVIAVMQEIGRHRTPSSFLRAWRKVSQQ